MPTDFSLTISEILSSYHFRDATLLAGASGLNLPVKWVHILEVRENIDQLVNGHELILTTGVGFKDEDMAINFLKQLILKNVSGLCIELGTYFTQIPESMIKLAEENDFPLIVFNKTIRFIDITQELHTMIISRSSEMFSRVEKFYHKLNILLTSAHEFGDILNFAHQYLNINVAFMPINAEAIFVPNIPFQRQRKFLEYINKMQNNSQKDGISDNEIISQSNSAGKPVIVLDQKMGDLYFFSERRMLTDFEQLVLGKCALAAAQDILRELYVKEKRNQEENCWIKNWIKGEYNETDIYQRLANLNLMGKVSRFCICLIDLDKKNIKNSSPNKLKELMIHTTIVTRRIFEREGFFLLNCFNQNEIIYIIFDWGNTETWLHRARNAVEEIKRNNHLSSANSRNFYGIGKIADRLSEIQYCLETAREGIHIQKQLGIEEPVYDMLHIYRMISKLEKTCCLSDFIGDYLGPVIEYDAHNQSDLINTLKVFFECNCSKQKTAEKLFVVRQTMYFRLKKIMDLLGEDFMSREKRISIEFAICAYDYLNKRKCNAISK